MKTHYPKMSCGNCGASIFNIFGDKDELELIAQCTVCLSTTRIRIVQPKLDFRFGENSNGILCIMNDEVLEIVMENEL